ncbi:MAG: hypothetical protein ACK5N8_08770 [Alphaproteobacteria bacterium]
MNNVSNKLDDKSCRLLQITPGKSESFDPFEAKFGRKFSLIETFLLRDSLDLENTLKRVENTQINLLQEQSKINYNTNLTFKNYNLR